MFNFEKILNFQSMDCTQDSAKAVPYVVGSNFEFSDDMDCKQYESILYFKNDSELQSMAIRENLVNVFSPQLSKQELIKTLVVGFKKRKNITSYTKNKIWDMYIGKEVGQHPCLLCKSVIINQLNFQCSYGIPKIKGGADTVNNLLPICNKCDLDKGCSRTISEYMQNIGKTRMQFLYEKMKNINDNCILSNEILNSRNSIKLTDEQLCRIIATNPMLWNQFTYLCEKANSNSFLRKKIIINIWEKMLILTL